MEITLIDIVLIVLVLVSSYTDLRRGKVHNVTTFPAMVLGLALNGFLGGTGGLSESIRAGALAFALLIVPVAMRGIGAGDLKLLVAVGMLEGSSFVLFTFLYSALAAGAVSAVIIGYRRLAPVAFPAHAEWGPGRVKALPYAVAIGLGCLLALYGR